MGTQSIGRSPLTTALLIVGAFLWSMSIWFALSSDPESLPIQNAQPISRFVAFAGAIVFGAGLYHQMNSLDRQIDKLTNRIQSDVEVGKGLYDLVREAGVIEKESLRIFKPEDVHDFRSVFSGAQHIMAYNPPLNLLANGAGHRKVIYDALNNDGASYRLIAGVSLLSRVRELRKRWKSQLQTGHKIAEINRNLSKFKIVVYAHDEDLFTRVDNWMDDPEVDLRGLSFFLIQGDTTNTVVLYILGAPFVRTFNVPSKAIAISKKRYSDDGRELEFPLFNEIKQEFESRWSQLSTRFRDGKTDNCIETNLIDFDIPKLKPFL